MKSPVGVGIHENKMVDSFLSRNKIFELQNAQYYRHIFIYLHYII